MNAVETTRIYKISLDELKVAFKIEGAKLEGASAVTDQLLSLRTSEHITAEQK